MMYPTNMQNTNLKYFVFWATIKWQSVDMSMYMLKIPNFVIFV
jgi:hypothetical protein